MIKKWFCKHDYKLVNNYTIDSDPTIGYRAEKMCVIYCPKCRKQKKIPEYEYFIILEKQKVDAEYAKQLQRNSDK